MPAIQDFECLFLDGGGDLVQRQSTFTGPSFELNHRGSHGRVETQMGTLVRLQTFLFVPQINNLKRSDIVIYFSHEEDFLWDRQSGIDGSP
jgi:hypothetical protein